MNLKTWSVAITLLLCSIPLFGNPFTDGRSDQIPPQQYHQPSPRQSENSVTQGIRRLTAVLPAQLQRSLNRQLSAVMDHGQGQSSRAIPIAAAIAFLYGLIHAALPGHRKILLVSYFLASDSRIRHAVVAGSATAILHAGAGAAVVLSAWFLLQISVTAAINSTTILVQQITAGAAVAVGCVLLLAKLYEGLQWLRRRSIKPAHKADITKDHQDSPGRLATWLSRGRLLPAIVLSAAIPCPGSSMILLFALSVGSLSIGLIAVAMFAAGMGVTLTAICLIAVLGKQKMVEKMHGSTGHVLHEILEIAAAAAIILFGLLWISISSTGY
ncbi:MAG: hypothetical protein ACOCVC_04810 [Spirochaeta sp.]